MGSTLRRTSNIRHTQSTAPKLRMALRASPPSLRQDQQRVEFAQGPVELLLPVKSEDSRPANATDRQWNKCCPAERRNRSDCSRKHAEKANSPVRVKVEKSNESDPNLCAEGTSGNCRPSGHMPHPVSSNGLDDEAQQAGDCNEPMPTGEDRKSSLESECEEPPLSPRSEKKRMKRFR